MSDLHILNVSSETLALSWLSEQMYMHKPTKSFKCNKIMNSCNRPWIAKEIPRKKKKVGDITFDDFKLYYKAIIIKTRCYGHKKQINRAIEGNLEPRNKLMHIQLIFDKEAKNTQQRKSLFNKWSGRIKYSHVKEWSWIHILYKTQNLIQNELKA